MFGRKSAGCQLSATDLRRLGICSLTNPSLLLITSIRAVSNFDASDVAIALASFEVKFAVNVLKIQQISLAFNTFVYTYENRQPLKRNLPYNAGFTYHIFNAVAAGLFR